MKPRIMTVPQSTRLLHDNSQSTPMPDNNTEEWQHIGHTCLGYIHNGVLHVAGTVKVLVHLERRSIKLENLNGHHLTSKYQRLLKKEAGNPSDKNISKIVEAMDIATTQANSNTQVAANIWSFIRKCSPIEDFNPKGAE